MNVVDAILITAAKAYAYATREQSGWDAWGDSPNPDALWADLSPYQQRAVMEGMRAALLSILEDPDMDDTKRHVEVAQAAAEMRRAAEATGNDDMLRWATLLGLVQAERVRFREERDEARGIVRETLWMARRYVDGRMTYAVAAYNAAAMIAVGGGYAGPEGPDGTYLAGDGTPQRDPLADLVADTIAWQIETFGPGERTAGVLAHIRKELVEIEAKPFDLEEWVDVLFLAVNGAARQGFTASQIVSMWAAKLAKNRARTWPDWRTVAPDKPIEHDRTGEAAE